MPAVAVALLKTIFRLLLVQVVAAAAADLVVMVELHLV
jgi:hypothetical protein